jgi:hypothetical protein
MARVNGSGEWIGGRRRKKVRALYYPRPLVSARNTSRDYRPGAIIAGWSRREPPFSHGS